MKIVGYISGSTISPLPSIKLEYLTHLIYSDVGPASPTDPTLLCHWTGENVLTSTDYNINQCVAVGHAKGIKVMVSLYNYGTYPATGDYLAEICRSFTLRTQLIANIKSMLTMYNLDGIDINWELTAGVEHQAAESVLVQELYAAVHPLGKSISISGNQHPADAWMGFDITLAASQYIDFVNVMCYDWDPPVHAPYDIATIGMQQWANAGYPKSKLLMGIPFYGYDSDKTAVFYGEIVDALNPTPDQNQANIASITTPRTGTIPINGGILWWNGINLAKQKVDFVLANGFGGIMCYDVGEDKLNDPRSLLLNIYEEVTMVNVFLPNAQKTATAKISVSVAGLACIAEIFLGPDDQHKVATSGPIAFTSATAGTNVAMPIKMPAAGGVYHVYIDVSYQGTIFLSFQATEDVLILSGTVEPPIWT